MRRSAARAVVVFLGAAGIAGATLIASAAPAGAQDGQRMVTICHHTGSDTNPIEEITVAVPSLPAHFAHGDTLAGGRGCGTDPGPGPDPEDKVTICHRTNGRNPYVRITIDESAIPAHQNHPGDDIIPAPPGGCPGTPPPPTAPPVVRNPPPIVRPSAPNPPAAPPPVVASSGAVATPAELPRTGGGVAVQLAVALGLLALGGLCMKGSSWATASAGGTVVPSGPAPTRLSLRPEPAGAHRSTETPWSSWSTFRRQLAYAGHAPPSARAGPIHARRRRPRAP